MAIPSQNYGVGNLILPAGGPRVVSSHCDLTTASTADVDLTNFFDRGIMDYIQGAMVDNWNGNKDLELTINNGTRQRIMVPANSQAWLPLFVMDGSSQFTLNAIGGSPAIVIPIFFYNIPLQPVINRKIFPTA